MQLAVNANTSTASKTGIVSATKFPARTMREYVNTLEAACTVSANASVSFKEGKKDMATTPLRVVLDVALIYMIGYWLVGFPLPEWTVRVCSTAQ